jgi:hypothetical protein
MVMHLTWTGQEKLNGNENKRKWQTWNFSKKRHVPHCMQCHKVDERIVNIYYDYQKCGRQYIGFK